MVGTKMRQPARVRHFLDAPRPPDSIGRFGPNASFSGLIEDICHPPSQSGLPSGRKSTPEVCEFPTSGQRSRKPPFSDLYAPGKPDAAVRSYVRDLKNVVNMDAIRSAKLKLGVDPLGGAARPYWEPINSIYGMDIAVGNPTIDATFSFMTVDHDGKIRMDC